MANDYNDYNPTFFNNFAIKIISFFPYQTIEKFYTLQFWKIIKTFVESIILLLIKIDASSISLSIEQVKNYLVYKSKNKSSNHPIHFFYSLT